MPDESPSDSSGAQIPLNSRPERVGIRPPREPLPLLQENSPPPLPCCRNPAGSAEPSLLRRELRYAGAFR
ncbi:hypothetical protein B8V81_2456 [Paenibacillus pasadenensis]|uniref:Uncharacterized protein n=1 Tax=Paenibacillus pasadenensis TaxID=217090 RepID=A0A2N5N133_9BACL|nr:hypothetical protein B8V81_2456 [Paenibacillus pasadenensis]